MSTDGFSSFSEDDRGDDDDVVPYSDDETDNELDSSTERLDDIEQSQIKEQPDDQRQAKNGKSEIIQLRPR